MAVASCASRVLDVTGAPIAGHDGFFHKSTQI